ncbi:MAG: aminoacyl-tRNA hydrolase [Alphaproteobacteria bacterium]|nr:aminoacyl-tRNA hydrolase [Alphaproteobacteria bacterium]
MKLIVGLGNPGEKYARNRHNVGFMTLDRIAGKYARGGWRKKFSALVCDAEIGAVKALLLCPQTYYNEAGRAVSEAARFHKIDAADVIVFHDEIDLVPGKVRVKTGGGHAGNNGLRSIASHIGPDFLRVRIGVGHPGSKDAVASYVLHDFPKADAEGLDCMLDAMAAAIPLLVEGGNDRFQTAVAQALNDFRKGGDGDQPPRADAETDRASARPATARHPSAERHSKRKSALAENLKRWLAGRDNKEH